MTDAPARNAGAILLARLTFSADLATGSDIESPARSHPGGLAHSPQDRMVCAF
jgi:hypothetical protein